MSDELKTIKFQMMLSESEAKQIDDWGFAHRIRSRAEAIRRLCQMGMQADKDLEQIQAQTDATYEYVADRVTKAIERVRSWKTPEDFQKNITEFLLMYADSMEIVGNLGSTVKEAHERKNVMKGENEVPELIEKASQVEREYNRAKQDLKTIFAKKD